MLHTPLLVSNTTQKRKMVLGSEILVHRPFWRLVWVVCLLGLWSGGCERVPSPSAYETTRRSIINGAQDISNPAIGALMRRAGSGYSPFCTGTLLSSRLVVTAAHCVEGVADDLGNFRFRVDTPNADGVTFTTALYEVQESAAHPRYSRSVSVQAYSDYDVAIWILKQPVSGVIPVPVNRTAIPTTWLTTDLKLVGYGLVQTQPQRLSAQSKQSAMIPLDEIRPRSFRHWDKATKKSVCNGDSGGPALYTVNGVEYILGVSSVVEGATPDPQTNMTFCDSAGVSTRLDVNIAFLEPYLKRYADTPPTCTTDADCGACGACQQGACGAATVSATTYCKPCATDADCGFSGQCLRTSEGFRCMQPCTDAACYQCPSGGICQTVAGGGAQATLSCRPSNGVCPPASCQTNADCGPAELCTQGVCKIERPTPIAQLCRPCKSSADCGVGFCLEPASGLGYCVQGCGAGDYCPEGFLCTQLTQGTKQCIPQAGCFMRCDDVTACPNGYTCSGGSCKRDGGGKDGDFCADGFTCAPNYRCLSEDDGSGRCALNCAPNGLVAGNACGSNRACDTDLSCFGTRTPACMKDCTNIGQACAEGGICTDVQQGVIVCICRSDSDCKADQFCNINRWASSALGGCVDKTKAPPPCPDSLVCRSASSSKSCLPEDGDLRAGALCSRTLRCQPGLACYNFDGTPRCMEPCDSNNTCSNGGGCADFGGGLLLCVCQRDQDCGLGKQCDLVFRDQGVGICRPAFNANCTADKDCPKDYTCNAGACVFAKPTEPIEEKPSEMPTEPTPELFEPAVEKVAENAPEEAVVVSEEIAQDAGPSDSSNNSPEMITEPKILGGGCGCSVASGEKDSSLWLAFFAVFGLFLWGRRKRT